MKLRPIDEIDPKHLPDLLRDYRSFVGKKTAFHIEFVWAEGSFDNKDEEASFMLDDDAPEPCEELEKAFERANWERAGLEIALIDVRRNLKLLLMLCLGLSTALAFAML